MKKIYYLSMLLPVILFSCDKMPEAHFSTDAIEPEVGQEVFFDNDSKHADSFEWDFGDGVVSTTENPSHIFTGTGNFTVTLIAYNSGMDDEATMDIEIFIPTLLEVDVFEWNEDWSYDYPISGISVWLFPDSNSWDSKENNVAEGFTDNDGVVVFSHLDEQKYYVDIWSDNYDNYTLRDEDVGFIETDVIMPHKINWFVAWVDYYDSGTKSEGRRGRSFVIKRLDRKVADVKGPMANKDWQTLYDKSIKMK
jgi:PKD repeat protein